MNMRWQSRAVPFKFQLSDKTLFATTLRLQVGEIDRIEDVAETAALPPKDTLPSDCKGFLIRSLPVNCVLPKLQKTDHFLRYVPAQYPRYFIDLRQSFEAYKQQFSSKTRSTLNRKVKKYAEHCGGTIHWKVYQTPDEALEFHRLAREVSAKTYQEKLLDAGLPDSLEFRQTMKKLADEGCMRAFILFDGQQPVSYLYCPIRDGVLIYQFLGYDPGYLKLSVGTVLQWLALEHLFEEGRFRLFDFTEGESDHKRLFATHSLRCANVFFLQPTLQNRILLRSQMSVDYFSNWIGNKLDQYGLKAKIKKLIRFGK